MFRLVLLLLNANGRRLVRLPRWAVILSLVTATSLGLVILLVAASVALIAVPVLFATGAIMHWFSRRGAVDIRRGPAMQGGGDPQIIDAEYRIIEPGERR